jgi:hypothetical protein
MGCQRSPLSTICYGHMVCKRTVQQRETSSWEVESAQGCGTFCRQTTPLDIEQIAEKLGNAVDATLWWAPASAWLALICADKGRGGGFFGQATG